MGKKKGFKKEKDDNVIEVYNKMSKKNAVALGIFAVAEALLYYAVTPTINLHNMGSWVWILASVFALMFCTMDFNSMRRAGRQFNDMPGHTKVSKILGFIPKVGIVVLILGAILSSQLINSSKYASLIDISTGDFATDIIESEDINDIALMDTDSARIIGERTIGSLSEVVSQYEVSPNYSTIDYNGKPMKVASLEYAGFFKYMNNRKSGIPGYVLVDPVKNEAKYVELNKPIKYSPSAYFNNNLRRHVQFQYPFYEFYDFHLELDNEGNPYYICPVLTPNAGLFGAKDVKGIVICDPCTGDSEYMDVADVPQWVDRVYDGDLATAKYDWYGNLSGGYINSVIGNKGCKVTTDDYGYKVMGGDVWAYTGVTSVNGDKSNIGFVLMNLRTAESKYYEIAGAEEHSAMSSAEGQVQHLGYVASFPSLINIKGVPTYIMVLKDNAGLVKMYALVNVEKYSIVATAPTQREALTQYKKLLAENEIATSQDFSDDSLKTEKIDVVDIKFIAVEGDTFVYITDKKGNCYKQAFEENEQLILIQAGDKVTIQYIEEESGINTLVSIVKEK